MKLPAKYRQTIYRFRTPINLSEEQFLKIKSTEKSEYLKSVKDKIKNERRVYLRHHRFSLITFWISVNLSIVTIVLILTSAFYKFHIILGIKQLLTIIFIVLVLSIIILVILQLNGFSGSFLSFRQYLQEKYDHYSRLKDTIDDSKDFYTFKEKYY